MAWLARCALFVAAENGAQVTLIEKNPAGVGLRSSAISAVGSRYQQAAGVEINKEDLVNDVASYALNQCDMRLIRSWADNSADVVNWLGDLYEKNGFTFHLEYAMPEGTRYRMWPTGHGTVNAADDTPADESAVLAAVMKHYEEVGGTFMPTTKLVSLIKEGDSVVGAYAENADEKPIRINASKGVVVATGGYVNNNEMYVARQNGLDKSLTGPLNFGTAQGDGIKACLWAGAHLDAFPTTMIFDRGVVKPDYELGQYFDGGDFFHLTFSTQPFLKVGKDGRRICNESSPYDYIVHAAQESPAAPGIPSGIPAGRKTSRASPPSAVRPCTSAKAPTIIPMGSTGRKPICRKASSRATSWKRPRWKNWPTSWGLTTRKPSSPRWRTTTACTRKATTTSSARTRFACRPSTRRRSMA